MIVFVDQQKKKQNKLENSMSHSQRDEQDSEGVTFITVPACQATHHRQFQDQIHFLTRSWTGPAARGCSFV